MNTVAKVEKVVRRRNFLPLIEELARQFEKKKTLFERKVGNDFFLLN